MPALPPFEFPEVRPGEPMVMSASTFVAFERCRDQALGRMRGIYGRESRASFVGGLAHRIFARHLESGPIPESGLVAACRQEIGEGMNPKLGSLGLKPSQLRAVIEEVGDLYDRFRVVTTDGFEGAEVMMESKPAEGLTLRGSIDAVFEGDGGVRLVDWKTGGIGEPLIQLGFYAMLWALDRGEIPSRVEAVSVGTGERLDAVPSHHDLVETAGRVAGAVSTMRAAFETGDGLERRAGPWCRWCPLLDDCDEGRAATDILGR